MTELLPNFAAGRWQHGTGPGTALWDPVLGTALVRVDAAGLDLAEAFAFARDMGGAEVNRHVLAALSQGYLLYI
mgnify:CR=1 FL=1